MFILQIDNLTWYAYPDRESAMDARMALMVPDECNDDGTVWRWYAPPMYEVGDWHSYVHREFTFPR